jgi:hypothetical protein
MYPYLTLPKLLTKPVIPPDFKCIFTSSSMMTFRVHLVLGKWLFSNLEATFHVLFQSVVQWLRLTRNVLRTVEFHVYCSDPPNEQLNKYHTRKDPYPISGYQAPE